MNIDNPNRISQLVDEETDEEDNEVSFSFIIFCFLISFVWLLNNYNIFFLIFFKNLKIIFSLKFIKINLNIKIFYVCIMPT